MIRDYPRIDVADQFSRAAFDHRQPTGWILRLSFSVNHLGHFWFTYLLLDKNGGAERARPNIR